jgi:hypothetical protein
MVKCSNHLFLMGINPFFYIKYFFEFDDGSD